MIETFTGGLEPTTGQHSIKLEIAELTDMQVLFRISRLMPFLKIFENDESGRLNLILRYFERQCTISFFYVIIHCKTSVK